MSRNGHSLLLDCSFLMMMTGEKWSSHEGRRCYDDGSLVVFGSLATCVWPFNGRVSGQSLLILQPFLTLSLSFILFPSFLRNLSSFFISFTLDIKEPLSSPYFTSSHKYMRRSHSKKGRIELILRQKVLKWEKKRGDRCDGMKKSRNGSYGPNERME